MYLSRVRRAVAPAVVLLCAGCQVYTPISLSSDGPKDAIRLTLTDRGSVDLVKALGSGATQVQGHVDAVTDSTIVLRIAVLTRGSGSEEKWSGEPVPIPRSDVAAVERRTTSVARSMLVGGAIVAGAVLAGSIAGSAVGGSTNTPPVSVK